MLIINSLCSATTDHSSLLHLARFHHSIIWQKGNTSKRISIGGVPVLHSWMFFFFLWLNPYLHHSPSGPLVPDATARLFSGWAIWAALYWRSIESKYSAFLVGLLFFFNVLPPKTWTHIQTDGTDKWKTAVWAECLHSLVLKKRGQCYAKSLIVHCWKLFLE